MADQYACLFDLDGVVLDTQTDYWWWWKDINARYLPNDPSLLEYITGPSLELTMNKYFKDDPIAQENIIRELEEFEKNTLKYNYFPRVKEFIELLKENKFKIGLVTSSNEKKMGFIFDKHPEFKTMFDVIIDADKVKNHKPSPDGYLLAAQTLNCPKERCFVFEDSFTGLESGRNAQMTVIGVASTNSKEAIQSFCDHVIQDFTTITIEELMSYNKYK